LTNIHHFLSGERVMQACGSLCFVCAIALLTLSNQAVAVPITIGFDATVTVGTPGFPFELPFTVTVGDKITGRFTFEPGVGDPVEIRREFPQSENFVVLIDGVTLSSSAYSIAVHNDEIFFENTSAQRSFDIIEVGCSRPGLSISCNPEVIDLGEGNLFSFRPLLSLVGSTDILSDTGIPTDVRAWNDLDTSAVLQINFDGLGSGGSGIGVFLGVIARVNNFWVVPEPSSLVLCVVALVGLFGFRTSNWSLVGVSLGIRDSRAIGRRHYSYPFSRGHINLAIRTRFPSPAKLAAACVRRLTEQSKGLDLRSKIPARSGDLRRARFFSLVPTQSMGIME